MTALLTPSTETLLPGYQSLLAHRMNYLTRERQVEKIATEGGKHALLPYCLRSCCWHLQDYIVRQHEIGEKYIKQIQTNTTFNIQAVEEGERLIVAIDAFLVFARRTQDALIGCVGRFLRTSLPNKITDFIKSRPERVPEELFEVIHTYWVAHGEAVKKYRDLFVHKATILASDVRLFMSATNELACYCVLPNNVGDENLDVNQDGMPAFVWMEGAWCEMLTMCRNVIEILLRETVADRSKAVIALSRTPHYIGGGHKMRGTRIVDPRSYAPNLLKRIQKETGTKS